MLQLFIALISTQEKVNVHILAEHCVSLLASLQNKHYKNAIRLSCTASHIQLFPDILLK